MPRKNLRTVCGVPIVCRAGLCANKVPEIDRVVVSTDDDEIAIVAESYDIAAPFRRPAEISGDNASDWEVMDHALRIMDAEDGDPYDIVVLLQPTAPLRRSKDVSGAIQMLIDRRLDAVWTVTETDLKYHPAKQMRVDDGLISFVMPEGAAIPPRQFLDPVYHVNGVAYALTRQCVLEQRHRLGERTGAFIINGPSLSIDSDEDFTAVEELLARGA